MKWLYFEISKIMIYDIYMILNMNVLFIFYSPDLSLCLFVWFCLLMILSYHTPINPKQFQEYLSSQSG